MERDDLIGHAKPGGAQEELPRHLQEGAERRFWVAFTREHGDTDRQVSTSTGNTIGGPPP